MAFRGFEGPAGTGKTHQLVEAVKTHLTTFPLESDQRVLALTFMHGSRRRLDARLRSSPELSGRTVCMTIDSFARTVILRWRSLAHRINAHLGDFNQTCDACGYLLEQPGVAQWVARSFPVIIVDEAQELSVERLRILKALEAHASLFVAADEFQCLDETIDTKPFLDWFQTGQITTLSRVHRTGQQGLLNAGVALRSLRSPRNGSGLRIDYYYNNLMPFHVASAISRANGRRAVLYGPGGREWADKLIQRLTQGMQSPKFGTIPALPLVHEDTAKASISELTGLFDDTDEWPHNEILAALETIPAPPAWLPLIMNTLDREHRTCGKASWGKTELIELVERKANQHRSYGYGQARGIPVMSIHQAKNREFDSVFLLWPPGIRGDGEQQARLLYNGITRAKGLCRVFVRVQDLLSAAPFSFSNPNKDQ
ncbi:ATP-dependent helicase [Hyphomonas sp. UBA1923]|uniref:ATP-dependent helicase n=1 Tax=Hyphomonas sp. UBA1923 TaxID=1946617 RepID=UPI0025BFB869|nr:ATP-dependent helicase [Hyphomonas sp. UBA1923]